MFTERPKTPEPEIVEEVVPEAAQEPELPPPPPPPMDEPPQFIEVYSDTVSALAWHRIYFS